MGRLRVTTWTALRERARDERGVGMVTALMITATVFALGAAWTNIGTHQIESSSFEKLREQALNSAEAGINYAASRLAGDMYWAGTTAPMAMADDSGEFEVTVTPVNPADPDDLDRYIVAKGYAPTKASNRKAQRQVEQQVELSPTDGFAFALFASPGGISGQNHANITGDVYSAVNVALSQNTNVYGDVLTRGAFSTSNNSLIAGDVHALGNVDIQNNQSTVQGSVLSGGNITVGGQVQGHAQATGTITVQTNGSIAGTVQPLSPPPEPPALSQPTFVWDPTNYPSSSSYVSATAFMASWNLNKNSFSGHHRVNGGDSASNKITFDSKWKLAGDTTIVSDGPITLSRDIENLSGTDVTLVIVSFSDRTPALEFTNNVTWPASVKIVLFAPNGSADFSQLKDFHGVVYAEAINLSQYFTLSYDPPEVPGFEWSPASVTHFEVQVRTFREVPFGT